MAPLGRAAFRVGPRGTGKSAERPEDGDDSPHERAGLQEHRTVNVGAERLDRTVQRGHCGAQRLRRHVLTMLGCLADGIRRHVGVGTLNADLGQLTGEGE